MLVAAHQLNSSVILLWSAVMAGRRRLVPTRPRQSVGAWLHLLESRLLLLAEPSSQRDQDGRGDQRAEGGAGHRLERGVVPKPDTRPGHQPNGRERQEEPGAQG
jgi:hypothetical protein